MLQLKDYMQLSFFKPPDFYFCLWVGSGRWVEGWLLCMLEFLVRAGFKYGLVLFGCGVGFCSYLL